MHQSACHYLSVSVSLFLSLSVFLIFPFSFALPPLSLSCSYYVGQCEFWISHDTVRAAKRWSMADAVVSIRRISTTIPFLSVGNLPLNGKKSSLDHQMRNDIILYFKTLVEKQSAILFSSIEFRRPSIRKYVSGHCLFIIWGP